MTPDLIERLAAAEHASWARWMDWLFQVSQQYSDGSVRIPSFLVERWKSQAATPYAELSEAEKESDREEVRKILPIIEAAFARDIRP